MRGGGTHYTHITKYALSSRSWKCHNKARNFIARASDQIEPLTNNSGKNIQILSSYFTYFFSLQHRNLLRLLLKEVSSTECLSKDEGNLSNARKRRNFVLFGESWN